MLGNVNCLQKEEATEEGREVTVRSQRTMPIHEKERRTLNAQALWIYFTCSAFNVV